MDQKSSVKSELREKSKNELRMGLLESCLGGHPKSNECVIGLGK